MQYHYKFIFHSSWHDGKSWNVVIDTTEVGDLGREGVPKLRPYSETYDYARLTDQDKLNVSVNIYEKVRNESKVNQSIIRFLYNNHTIYFRVQ